MRTLLLFIAMAFALGACGYRTPLALPKPGVKPPAPPAPTAPAPALETSK